jgi:hypothetical protein
VFPRNSKIVRDLKYLILEAENSWRLRFNFLVSRYYIGYKTLKKRIKQYASRAASASDDERDEIIRTFSRLLDSQVHNTTL